MQLEDWLDDLCVRFILNLPQEELASVERICFQVEEAQWFYEDFIRPLDASLPHLDLRNFSLRIFQHCPLFAQWSAQHYQTAFAEFMSYKQRVPVRGAIMLNDDMDEVVLVKGWKKSANWSFPRGKINKDEDDLDCAVREVYEETGLDLRSAGLVPERDQVKSIEMTMREQHMKLFVFRGIPRDTHFEARTRKEISKIEWYKLTDLPTFKKRNKHEGNGQEQPGISANKFYMVAPFLGHLKKWIAIQKKRDSRYSSNLAAPPLVAEESEMEVVPEQFQAVRPEVASDLPEVSSANADPTSQLKAMFNIPGVPPQLEPQPPPPTHMPQVDALKSNALLSLLRNGSAAELRASPQTPLDQVSFHQDPPQSPHRSHVAQHPSAVISPPPHFGVQSELPTSPPATQTLTVPARQPHQPPLSASFPFQLPVGAHGVAGPAAPMQPVRGGPDMIHQRHPEPERGLEAPPASALPQLTNHTKSLLDVFKGVASPPPPPPSVVPSRGKAPTQPPNSSQTLLNILRQPAPAPQTTQAPPPPQNTATTVVSPTESMMHDSNHAHQSNLLGLFGASKATAKPPSNPAELAATPAEHQPPDPNKSRLLALLQQDESAGFNKQRNSPKEGETAATIPGPLDQPNFEAISQKQEKNSNSMGRSPLTTHRKLYNPKEPAPVKILARPQTPKGVKSPQPAKAKMANQSPKRTPKASRKDKDKEQEPSKPAFQPQILRRPQTVDKSEPSPSTLVEGAAAMSREQSSEQEHVASERRASHPDSHKQALLSLFGGKMPPPPAKLSQQSSRVVSPLSTSQVLSPKDEVPVSAIEPVSTKSRVGSMASVGSGIAGQRPPTEKRTTGAENKAFLMNYLGRMASQDG